MESGLVSLRAELHKKKSEAKISNEQKLIKPLFKEQKKLKKEKSKLNAKAPIPDDDEESRKLENSRKALERKSLLYDQIKSGTKVLEDDELNEKFLVNFQGKIYDEVSKAKKEREAIANSELIKSTSKEGDADLYKAKNPSEEWVEYTDSFGRSRICLQKDVEYLTDIKDLPQNYSKPPNVLQEKWNKIEDESKSKKDIHYQDVLFDEARTHGTGFMPFSRDEKEREAQQQFLKDIGTEATKMTLSREALKRKRQKLMEERLAKVRQKKRLKMGLPVKDDDRLKTPPPSEDEDEDTSNNDKNVEVTSETVTESVVNVEENETNTSHIREWDIGKPGVASTMSQEQWIESQRKERDKDFAPPTNYNKSNFSPPSKYNKSNFAPPTKYNKHKFAPPTNYYKSTQSNRESEPRKDENVFGHQSSNQPTDLINSKREDRCPAFSPPSTYEYYRPLKTKNKNFIHGQSIDLESAISKGLSQIRRSCDKSNNSE